MKRGTIIIIAILALVIVGGILFYRYTQDSNPLTPDNDSGLDKIESAINNKIQGCSGGVFSLFQSCNHVASCADACSPSGTKTCSGGGFKTCGNYDSDSCLEWSSVTSCSSGQTCSNGQCITSTASGIDTIENAINQKLGN